MADLLIYMGLGVAGFGLVMIAAAIVVLVRMAMRGEDVQEGGR